MSSYITRIKHIQRTGARGWAQDGGGLFTNKARVLLVLSQDVLDRARVFAGRATTTLKLPVSLQIVLRALIEEGLKRDDNPALLTNVEFQANAVRRIRSTARRRGRAEGNRAESTAPGPPQRRSKARPTR
jgi:hypothetical protein